MGGKGSGGRRIGAGRPQKSQSLGELQGSRRTRDRAKQQPAGNSNDERNQKLPEAARAAPSNLPEVHIPEPPGSLTLDELAIWNELAPLAQKEGTLTDSTSMALRDLCEAIVLKRKLLRVVDAEGVSVYTVQGAKAAHPLLTQFRGLMQRVEAGMMRFRLSPMGKEIPKEGEQPSDPWSEFDGAAAAGASSRAH